MLFSTNNIFVSHLWIKCFYVKYLVSVICNDGYTYMYMWLSCGHMYKARKLEQLSIICSLFSIWNNQTIISEFIVHKNSEEAKTIPI